jgi:hypothetical protein
MGNHTLTSALLVSALVLFSSIVVTWRGIFPFGAF